MTDLAHSIERQLDAFVRRGPYGLLLVAMILVLVTAPALGAWGTVPVVAGCAIVLGAAHWLCVDRRWGRPLDDRLGVAYLVSRTALCFVVTVVNPFFAVFGFIGYIDAALYVRRSGVVATIVVTALTMAGSQSGGLPPRSGAQAAGFVGLFAFNLVLVLFFDRLAQRQDRLSEERAETIDALEESNARLAEALAENEALQERLVEQARQAGVHAERERLALEIHDTIAQSLAGVLTQLQAAADTADQDVAARHRERAADLARDALTEARRSVQGLLPIRLDEVSLVEALERLTAEWSQASGIEARLLVDGEAEPLHRDVESTVLRVAQEALANVDKHARASRVGVTLSFTGDVVMLDVRDDGIGFVVETLAAAGPQGGVGLHGMRQRAARVVGDVTVESAPGAGTAVSLQVPAVSGG